MINIIITHDKKKIFRFTPLQSSAGKQMLEKWQITELQKDSFVLIENKKIYLHSTAALKVYNKLDWYLKWTQLGWIFPTVFRDALYNFIARNRYKWFGKKEKCMVPSRDVSDRFLT